MTKQPNLTDFPTTIFATAKRRLQAAIRRGRELLAGRSLSGCSLLFEPVLPAETLARLDETQRQRCFGNIPVFWAWLAQILEASAPAKQRPSATRPEATRGQSSPPTRHPALGRRRQQRRYRPRSLGTRADER